VDRAYLPEVIEGKPVTTTEPAEATTERKAADSSLYAWSTQSHIEGD